MGIMSLCGNTARAFGPSIYAPIYENVDHRLPWICNIVTSLLGVLCAVIVKLKPAVADEDAEGGASDVPELKRQLSGQPTRNFLSGNPMGMATSFQSQGRGLARTLTWGGTPAPRDDIPTMTSLQRASTHN